MTLSFVTVFKFFIDNVPFCYVCPGQTIPSSPYHLVCHWYRVCLKKFLLNAFLSMPFLVALHFPMILSLCSSLVNCLLVPWGTFFYEGQRYSPGFSMSFGKGGPQVEPGVCHTPGLEFCPRQPPGIETLFRIQMML